MNEYSRLPEEVVKAIKYVRDTEPENSNEHKNPMDARNEVIWSLESKGYLPKNTLGFGAESLVFVNPDEPEIAIGVNWEPLRPYDVTANYWAQLVMSTIFPHNFPRIYSVWAITEDGIHIDDYGQNPLAYKDAAIYLTGTVREKITTGTSDTPHTFSFARVHKFFNEVKYLPFFIEDGNLMLGSDGGGYFLDTIRLHDTIKEEHINLVVQYLENNSVADKLTGQIRPYTQEEKEIVLHALQTLQNIQKEISSENERQLKEYFGVRWPPADPFDQLDMLLEFNKSKKK